MNSRLLIESKQGQLIGYSADVKLVDNKLFDLEILKPENYATIFLKDEEKDELRDSIQKLKNYYRKELGPEDHAQQIIKDIHKELFS